MPKERVWWLQMSFSPAERVNSAPPNPSARIEGPNGGRGKSRKARKEDKVSYNCRSADSYSSFRRALKTELFDFAYGECKHST